jgi:hypothetical protein
MSENYLTIEEITATTCNHLGEEVSVIVSELKDGKAEVQAVQGEPFKRHTHGGPAWYRDATVRIFGLRDVHINGVPVESWAMRHKQVRQLLTQPVPVLAYRRSICPTIM